MTRRQYPTQWPGQFIPTPGQSPQTSTIRVLDGASMFCAAEWSYTVTTWVGSPGASGTDAATDTDFGSGTPGRIYAHIPQWTTYVAWGVLLSATSGNNAVYLRRLNVDGASDAGSWVRLITTVAGDADEWRYCYEIDTTEPASQDRGVTHTNNVDGEWHELEFEWYLDGAEIKAIQMIPLVASYTDEAIGT